MFVALDRLRLFNFRELFVHLSRTTMSVAVFAVSAALLVAVFGISGSITESVNRLGADIAGNAALEVSGVTDAGFGQALQTELARVPGVAAAVPMIRADVGSADTRTLLIGIDPASAASLHSDLQRAVSAQTGGGTKLLTVPNGVLVGPGTGRSEGETFEADETTVTVAAVIDGPAAQGLNDGHFIMSTLALAQRITGRTGTIDSILLVAAPGSDVGVVRSAVDTVVAGRAVVADPNFRAAQAGGVIAVLRSTTLMAAALGLVVAGFLIYNAMSMAINQRRGVISTLRAIGGRKQVIVRDLLAEAAVLGAIGGVLGIGIGILMGRWTIGLLPAALVQSLQVRIGYALPGFTVPLVLTACVVACVGAAAVAARQVYKVAPIEALAPVGVSSADRIHLSLRIVAAVAGVGSIAVSIAAATIDLGLWSIGAVALFLDGAVFVCFACFDQLVAATVAVARYFGAPGALAAATIERAPRRVWVTVISVLIAVAMTVSITGSNKNGIDSAVDTFGPAAAVDVWVQPTSNEVFPTGPLLPNGIEQTIAALPGVAGVVPGQMAYASIKGSKVIVQGLAAGTRHPLFESLSASARAGMLAGAGVVVSRDIARTLGVRAGDDLTIPTPHGFQHVEVLEVFPYFSALTGFVGMSLPQLREWFDRPGSTLLEVTVQPGADRAAVQRAIGAAVPTSVHVYSGQQELAGTTASLQQATVLISAITWIVVFVAAVALVNTLMLSVLERRRELGVLRAIGSSRRFLLRMVLAEAAAIGVVGGICGLAIGVANQYVNTLAFTHVLGLDIAFGLTPATVVFGLGALLLCLAGAVPPALHAARLNIIDAVDVE
ncbi:ABC transporter permease [Nocardia anaemiae]|uniref:ABC transporter permease n=1 Tax=Nocardia anaemiae TaxID=263910 RepID=UPI0007A3B0BD|nr:FtsX-like permease family protein [Nocardia anaemiae]